MSGQWPFVGRANEVRFVESMLASADVAGVVLSGAEGVGKSRLARYIVHPTARRTPHVWVSATDSARCIPFGAFAHLLPAAFDPGGTRSNLLRRAADALCDPGSGQRPGLLCVDDAHLLDETSAALVHHLAIARTLRLLVTVRDGEPMPGSVAALWKDELLARVPVAPLGQAEARHLVKCVLGGVIDDLVHRRVWEGCQGNPLMTNLLVNGAVESGVIVKRREAWRWEGHASGVPRLRHWIEARIGRLTAKERAVMLSIAVAEPLDLSTLESLADSDVLDALEQRDLIRIERSDRRKIAKSTHPLFGEVIRASAPVRQALNATRQLAGFLRHQPRRRRDDVLRLASLLLEVGQDGDASLMLQAGREAIRRFDYGLAERFARAAARDPGASPAAEILLSEALIGQGRWADGELMLTRAASRCRTDGERVEVTIGRAQHLFWRLKQPADAVQAIADAVDHATDPIGREDLIANEAALALFGGRTIHAIKRARPVIERGIAKDGAVLLAGATTALGLALMGRVSETREVLTRTLDLGRAAAPSANFPFMAQWLGLVAGQAALFDGQIDQAVKDFTAANAALGDVVTDPRSATLFFLGFGRRVQGRVRTAADHLRQAVALLRDSDLYNHLPACLAELAHALALAGDVCGSEAALQEAEQRKTAAFVVDEVYFALARVRLAEAMGNRAGALARVREGAERLESLSYWPLAGLVLYERARLGHAREVQDRLARLAADVGGGLLPLLSDAAAALAAGDAPRLETASHRLEHAGGLLYAAEASAAAARAHEQAGRRAASAAAHERTRALAAQCEDVRHLADVQLDLERTLTPREREIALLASAGKSSREISTTLRLSIRTVENHLQAVYSKLGVAGRTGLMRVLSNSGCTTDFT